MKVHTTDYKNTFIQIAEDCPTDVGEVPPKKGDEKSVANIQYEMIKSNPYRYSSDDVVFQCFKIKKDLTDGEVEVAREAFFSKGQPCLRASPLTKRYGWGIHYDQEGKIALYGAESEAYKRFSSDKSLKVLKAMRSKKA